MATPKKITVDVPVNEFNYTTLGAAIKHLNELKDKHGEDAPFYQDVEYDYGDSTHVATYVTTSRLETQEEAEKREAYAAKIKEEQIARARATLAAYGEE